MQIRELVANGIAEILNQEQIIPPIEVPKESIAKIREQVLRLNRSTIPDHILVEYLKTLRDQRLIQCTIPHPGTDQGRHRELPFS
ncbi:MAG: hypothetical protein K1X60_00495 [Nitrospira sp.]|nr:hypothetical protein [Nitrospira sp.]MCW5794951.1 hypothetical protein [Nitrospira sp.]HNE32210.1 hypothetical protein [Nitrospira sp.]HNK49009.1 hypothetical protein [Nitrospira sp.]HNM17334.1 hypothetical protein [Nitrospira sp.]